MGRELSFMTEIASYFHLFDGLRGLSTIASTQKAPSPCMEWFRILRAMISERLPQVLTLQNTPGTETQNQTQVLM